jgi:DHA1 family bicyclomycin/chloramphenicol resistance-like MFS transporter
MSSHSKGQAEFIVLVAMLTAMVAMSIDTMLPAIGEMAKELGAPNPNDQQHILTSFFVGLTVGTLIYGPISDSTGRKPAILTGLAIYAIGSLLCYVAENFFTILAGRAMQGFGAAAPRIVSMAMVRDGQAGNAMARVMSFVMSVFMLVPILAPAVGQFALWAGSWRYIFAGFLVMSIAAAAWLAFRQPETLPRHRRLHFNLPVLWAAARETLTTPVTLGYTLAVGCIFGAFVCYLSSSAQIFQVQYDQGDAFALWFGGLAVAIAAAMIVNGKLVLKLGMRLLSKWALRGFIATSLLFLLLSLATGGHPPLWALGLYFFANFFCSGMIFGNYNAMAMEPMGHIGGMAAAVTGFISSLIAVATGGILGQFYDGNLVPLTMGFTILGCGAWVFSEWAERHR